MIALVHGTCFACEERSFARIDAARSLKPRYPGCGQPLDSLAPHLGRHVAWLIGEPLRPLHPLVLADMAVQHRSIMRASALPPMPPPTAGVPRGDADER